MPAESRDPLEVGPVPAPTPDFWSITRVSGDGDRVGDVVRGDGDGVLANGDTGIL